MQRQNLQLRCLIQKIAMSESDVESDEELQVTLSCFGDELVNRPHDNGVQRIDWSHQRGLVF